MTKKYILVEPSCPCLRDPGTDTSVECARQNHKGHLKKKRSVYFSEANAILHSKGRKETVSPKQVHSCVHTSHHCSKSSVNRSTPLVRTKSKKIYQCDETSTDGGSISSISQASTYSVDVSYEMAAVNQELDAVLSRAERALAGKVVADQAKAREELQRLRPRRPPFLRENLAPKLRSSSIQREPIPVLNRDPKTTPARSQLRLTDTPRSDSREFLKSMREEVSQRINLGNQEVGKNLKEIYSKMELDSKGEVKIDFDSLASYAKSCLAKEKSNPTPRKLPVQINSSVSTQTSYDYEKLIGNSSTLQEYDWNGSGDADMKFKKTFDTLNIKNKIDDNSIKPKSISFMELPSPQETSVYTVHTLEKNNQIRGNSFNEDNNKGYQYCSQSKTANLEKNYGMRSRMWQDSFAQKSGSFIQSLQNQHQSNGNDCLDSEHTDALNKDNSSINKNEKDLDNLKINTQSEEGSQRNFKLASRMENTKNPMVMEKQYETRTEESASTKNREDFNSYMSNTYKTHLSSKTNDATEEPTHQNSKNLKETKEYQTKKEQLYDTSKEFDMVKNVTKGLSNQINQEEVNSKPSIGDKLRADQSRDLDELQTNFSSKTNDMDCRNEYYQIKEAMKKENLEKLDPSLCMELIRRVTEAMMKCHPTELTDQFSTGKVYMNLLKQLRSDLLKNIQTTVKQIEDLDRCLEDHLIDKHTSQSQDQLSIDK